MKLILRNICFINLLAFSVLTWSLEAKSDDVFKSSEVTPHYAGVGVDLINFSLNRAGVLAHVPSLTQGASFKSNATNMHVFSGYRFDEFLAVQFDLIGLGKVNVTDLGAAKELFEPRLFSISAAINRPLSDNFTAFGKLGGTSWSLKSSTDITPRPNLGAGFGLNIGAGLDINLYGSKERAMRLEWNYYKMDGIIVNSANSLTLGVIFNF